MSPVITSGMLSNSIYVGNYMWHTIVNAHAMMMMMIMMMMNSVPVTTLINDSNYEYN